MAGTDLGRELRLEGGNCGAAGQEIAAQNYYRPTKESIAKKYSSQFPKTKLLTIDEVAGGWAKAQKLHFADGGIFDQIYQSK